MATVVLQAKDLPQAAVVPVPTNNNTNYPGIKQVR
jgi:hypothetical protein